MHLHFESVEQQGQLKSRTRSSGCAVTTEPPVAALRKLIRRRWPDFPVVLASATHHVRAAEIGYVCRRRGVACSAVDALIAAIRVESGGSRLNTEAVFSELRPTVA
jgi:predicted nucleic acid-binding protein